MNVYWFFGRNGNFFSTVPHLKVFGFLITTIAAVLGASVQGMAQPLKETHRVCLYVFLVAIIVYCIAFVAQRSQANHSHFWGLVAIICGSLSTVSVISGFFTHSVAEIICYITVGCAAIIIVVYQYGSTFMDILVVGSTMTFWNGFKLSISIPQNISKGQPTV